jgi:iron(III) transport system permease protein
VRGQHADLAQARHNDAAPNGGDVANGMDSSWSRFKYSWLHGDIVANTAKVISVIIVLSVAVPIIYVVYGAYESGIPGQAGSHLTTEWQDQVYGSGAYLSALTWSIVLGVVTATTATVIGGAFAWLLTRVEVPLRSLWQGVLLAGFALPPILATMAWTSLLAPNSGFINIWYNDITGHGNLIPLYSFATIAFVMTCVFVPLGYLLTAGAFSAVDISEEEAARTHGFSIRATLWHVTLRAVRRSVLVTWVLIFSISGQTFAVVVLLGAPANVQTIPELMYQGVTTGQIPLGLVTMLGTLLFWPALIAFVVLLFVQRKGDTVRVQPSLREGRWSLGRYHGPVLVVFGLYLAVSTLLPFAVLMLDSFLKYQTGHLTRSLFTLGNYTTALQDPDVLRALENTALLGVIVATVVVLLSFVVAYLQVSAPGSAAARFVEIVTAFPLALPRLGLSLGILWVTDSVPVLHRWTGSLILIAGSMILVNVGLGTRALSADMAQLPRGYVEAAKLAGMGSVDRAVRIIAPQLRVTLVETWRTVLILAFLEIDLVVFLYTPQSETLSIATLLDLSQGLSNTAYPLAVMQVALVACALVISGAIRGWMRRSSRRWA